MAFLSLPTELHLLIINNLNDERPNVAALCATCRYFDDLAAPLLYSSLILDTLSDYELVNRLTERHLALVRKLELAEDIIFASDADDEESLSPHSPAWYGQSNKILSNIMHIMPQMLNLESFVFSSNLEFRPAFMDVLMKLSSLKHLEITLNEDLIKYETINGFFQEPESDYLQDPNIVTEVDLENMQTPLLGVDKPYPASFKNLTTLVLENICGSFKDTIGDLAYTLVDNPGLERLRLGMSALVTYERGVCPKDEAEYWGASSFDTLCREALKKSSSEPVLLNLRSLELEIGGGFEISMESALYDKMDNDYMACYGHRRPDFDYTSIVGVHTLHRFADLSKLRKLECDNFGMWAGGGATEYQHLDVIVQHAVNLEEVIFNFPHESNFKFLTRLKSIKSVHFMMSGGTKIDYGVENFVSKFRTVIETCPLLKITWSSWRKDHWSNAVIDKAVLDAYEKDPKSLSC